LAVKIPLHFPLYQRGKGYESSPFRKGRVREGF